MADEITTKKVENLSENTEPADADVFLFGSGGTNAIKKIKWSNIFAKLRNLLFANNCTTTQAGYGLDARQGKALKDEIDKINTNMNNIKNDMGDLIKVVTQTGPHTFALDAHTSIEASSHVTLPKLDGYTRLIYFLKPNGNPSIIAAGPNTNWVTNTSTQKVNAVRLDSVGIFIKNI